MNYYVGISSSIGKSIYIIDTLNYLKTGILENSDIIEL